MVPVATAVTAAVPPPWLAPAEGFVPVAATAAPVAQGRLLDETSSFRDTLAGPRILDASKDSEETTTDWIDPICMQFFGAFSLLVEVFLISLLATHVPLACGNLTTIEENYDNMPNPFEHGSAVKNLSQVLGLPGLDWFLPLTPWRPVSDGISYPRVYEVLQQLMGERAKGPHGEELPPEPEERWRARYLPQMAAKSNDQPTAMSTLLAPISTAFGWGNN